MRRWLTLILMVAAVGALALGVAIMTGQVSDWTFGPLRIRVRDATRPLLAGLTLASILLLYRRADRGPRGAAVALVIVSGLLLLTDAARGAARHATAGDLAVIESYTLHALDGRLFVGAYSRFLWHHPGPLYFYLLAPFYALSDFRTEGLQAGALAVNLASALGIGWMAVTSARGSLAIALAGSAALFVWRADQMVASAWNPHVLALPAAWLVVAAAVLAAGRWSLLPLVGFVASFLAQTHVAAAPVAVAVTLTAVAAALVGTAAAADGERWRRCRRAAGLTLWVVAGAWFLPLTEQLHNRPGNLTLLWQDFADASRPGQPFGYASRVWAESFVGMLRPEFQMARGLPLEPGPAWWPGIVAASALVLLALIAARAARRGERFQLALATGLLVAALVSLWSATRVEGPIMDHVIFWVASLGALTFGLLAETALVAVWPRAAGLPAAVTTTACAIVCGVALALGWQQLGDAVERSARAGADERAALVLSADLHRFLEAHPDDRPLIRIEDRTWEVAAGTLVELQKAHARFAVDDAWIPMFTPAAGPTGAETTAVLFVGSETYERLRRDPSVRDVGRSGRVFVVAAPLEN